MKLAYDHAAKSLRGTGREAGQQACHHSAIFFLIAVLLAGAIGGLAQRAERAAIVRALEQLLASDQAESRNGALDWILRDHSAHEPALVEAILRAATSSQMATRTRGIRNLGWIYDELGERRALEALLAALQDSRPESSAAALEVIRTRRTRTAPGSDPQTGADLPPQAAPPSRLLGEKTVLAALASLLRSSDADTQSNALAAIQANPELRLQPPIYRELQPALASPVARNRALAVEALVAAHREAQDPRRAEIAAELKKALESPDTIIQAHAAEELGVPVPPAPARPAATQPVAGLDFNYFVTLVQPLLFKPYAQAQGASCATCHQPDRPGVGILRLPPRRAPAFTEADSWANYAAVLLAVNTARPLQSTLLLKPLNNRPPDGPKGLDHDGGVFWLDGRALDYQVVKAWLESARLERPVYDAPAFDVFVERVQPLLTRPAADGMACANCHFIHAILHLVPPEEGKPYTFEQLKSNYEAALRVVDLASPENSYLLRKPTSPREGAEATGLSHAGGVRWPAGRDSDEYHVILEWISRRASR